MSYKIRTIENFDRQAKKLAKHYHSFKTDFVKFLSDLQDNPYMGDDLGDGIRKVRMAIASKGKGKSGGARIITYTTDVVIEKQEGEIVLLSIYDKSEQSTISDNEIKELKKVALGEM
ncbi:MAG: type II toxin-antitoxin system RelE/ParE family toxin [Bacteroidales bacterium]|nr:type II toxin-antitoxin system RelE/ParE family toxin [Bacteroidales bacterium]